MSLTVRTSLSIIKSIMRFRFLEMPGRYTSSVIYYTFFKNPLPTHLRIHTGPQAYTNNDHVFLRRMVLANTCLHAYVAGYI